MEIQVRIISDGNCLFRCFSFCLFRTQTQYNVVKQAIIEYVSINWDIFKPFVTAENVYSKQILTRNAYLNYMSNDFTFGGEVEIQSFCELYPNIGILIYDDDFRLHYNRFDMNSTKLLVLRFKGVLDHGHYDIIKYESGLNYHDIKIIENKMNDEHKKKSLLNNEKI